MNTSTQKPARADRKKSVLDPREHRFCGEQSTDAPALAEQRVSDGLDPSAHQPRVQTGFEGSPDHGRLLRTIAVLSRRRRRLSRRTHRQRAR